MNKPFTLTGGAKIGNANASFPFANLSVDKDVLKINASFVGNLIFQPKDIISIEPYTKIKLFGQGIKINHRIGTYNSTVIFWSFKTPDYVISEIKKVGFLDNINNIESNAEASIIRRQEQGGFPIKKPVAIIFVVLWNILFLSDIIPFFLHLNNERNLIGNGVRMAIGLLLITSLLTLISGGFRKMILKEGVYLDDIYRFVMFIIFVSSLMLIFIKEHNFIK